MMYGAGMASGNTSRIAVSSAANWAFDVEETGEGSLPSTTRRETFRSRTVRRIRLRTDSMLSPGAIRTFALAVARVGRTLEALDPESCVRATVVRVRALG